ncbi:MAG: hypothetical protein IJ088_16980, partial [Clostridia bacterium]|nr:hypothetical protein [Clostridia bacterium]
SIYLSSINISREALILLAFMGIASEKEFCSLLTAFTGLQEINVVNESCISAPEEQYMSSLFEKADTSPSPLERMLCSSKSKRFVYTISDCPDFMRIMSVLVANVVRFRIESGPLPVRPLSGSE